MAAVLMNLARDNDRMNALAALHPLSTTSENLGPAGESAS